MPRRSLRPRADVCQLCDFMLARQSPRRVPFRPIKAVARWRASSTSTGSRISSQKPRTSEIKTPQVVESFSSADVTRTLSKAALLEEALQTARKSCDNLLALDTIPPETAIQAILVQYVRLAGNLVEETSPASTDTKDGAASALLSLDDAATKRRSLHKLPPTHKRMVEVLSRLAYSVVTFPPVFITPAVLELYVECQSRLGKPETLPEVFHMYGNKPLPREGSSPIQYSEQNPKKLSNAVPPATASKALQAAIDAKHLVVAMDIIEFSYTTTAFHKAKFVRQGLLPTTGLAAAPLAAYAISTQLAGLQTSMDTAMATNVAFAGFLAYIGLTATVGVVAVTTANDQMDRVTWAQGVPLRERWMREEERAAIDKVAGAWGFKEIWRRGEEEGEDWDALREWIGRKSMMLDRVELMEGME